jgi:hypothetical protein
MREGENCHPNGPAPLENIARYVPAVLLLPLLVLWSQDNPLFTPPGTSGPWVCFGYFRNLLEFKRSSLGNMDGTHLSWLLPGAALHAVLPPVAATLVLHLAVQTVASLSLFLTLAWLGGARRAFVTTLVFACHPWVWSAAGWDYTDGAGIAYALLTLALLTWSARVPRRRCSLLPAGMAVAATVYANADWLALAPLFPLYYLGLVRVWHRAPLRRALPAFCAWAGPGFVLVTAGFAAVNHRLDGHWFFYGASISAALADSRGESPWWLGLWSKHGPAPWLLLPMAAAGAALWTLLSERRRPFTAASLISALLLAATAWLALCQARGGPMLGTSYRAGVLLPFTFLVLGSTLWSELDRIRPRSFLLYGWALAAALGCAWFPDGVNAAAGLTYGGLAAVALLLASIAVRGAPEKSLFALAGVSLLTGLGVEITYSGTPWGANRRQLEAVSEARERLETVRQGRSVRFWYPLGEDIPAAATALAGSYGPAGDPSLSPRDPFPCGAGLPPSSIVAAIGPASPPLPACWQERGLRLAPLAAAASPFRMSLLRVEVVPGAWQSFPVEPVSTWTAVDGLTDVRASGAGLRVTTRAAAGSLAARSPGITAPESGHYRFVFRHLPESGPVRFGVVDPSGSWLAQGVRGVWDGGAYEVECWVRLAGGRQFALAVASANTTTLRPVVFQLEALAAGRTAR